MLTLEQCSLPDLKGAFSFGLDVRPGSVRDTIFRVESLCQEMIATRAILPGEHLLIVGGGPAALAAMAYFLSHDVIVVACNLPPGEDDESIQNCFTRVICPTTNDFPSEHWVGRKYPESLPSFPPSLGKMKWKAGTAEATFTQMTTRLEEIKRLRIPIVDYDVVEPGELLELTVRTEEGPDKVRTPALLAKIKHPVSGDAVRLFRAAIFCVGAGAHVNRFKLNGSNFSGYGWWSNADDDLAEPSTAAGKTVLILGGGDSGVSDFIRLLTGEIDPYHCLDKLGLDNVTLTLCKAVADRMWDDYEQRKVSDHDIYQQTLEQMVLLARKLWASESLRQKIFDQILLKDEHRPKVQLAADCYHFGLTYPANQLAAHLLAKAVASRQVHGAVNPLYPLRLGVRPESIVGAAGHECSGNAEQCAGAEHRVKFSLRRCDGVNCVPSFIREESASGVFSVSEEAMYCDRLILRLPPGFNPYPLPGNVAKAIQSARANLIRHVPDFYRA